MHYNKYKGKVIGIWSTDPFNHYFTAMPANTTVPLLLASNYIEILLQGVWVLPWRPGEACRDSVLLLFLTTDETIADTFPELCNLFCE